MAEKTVDAYIASLEGWQADVVAQVRQIVLAAAPECQGIDQVGAAGVRQQRPIRLCARIQGFGELSDSGAGPNWTIRSASCKVLATRCAMSS